MSSFHVRCWRDPKIFKLESFETGLCFEISNWQPFMSVHTLCGYCVEFYLFVGATRLYKDKVQKSGRSYKCEYLEKSVCSWTQLFYWKVGESGSANSPLRAMAVKILRLGIESLEVLYVQFESLFMSEAVICFKSFGLPSKEV